MKKTTETQYTPAPCPNYPSQNGKLGVWGSANDQPKSRQQQTPALYHAGNMLRVAAVRATLQCLHSRVSVCVRVVYLAAT